MNTRTLHELEAFLTEHGPYTVKEFRAADLRVTLNRFGWNRTRTAKHLSISRTQLWRRMTALGVTPGETFCHGSRKDS